ncbi:MAG: pilus assembly protein [Alphaproteobacteria bacterium]|nr:pilus assembly protein [Alphaproteobacteria bacterium]
MFRLRRRKLIADTSGAAAIEFAIISLVLVLFTFAILDVGFALYWFNRAEKATQMGVRVASVSNPVTDFLASFSGTGGGTAGVSCSDGSGVIIAACDHADITCSVSGTTGTCTSAGGSFGEPGNFVDAAFIKIFNEMMVMYPQLSSTNVQVEYRPSPLGFIGRPGAIADTYNLVPQVTVRIVNLEYNYIALGALLGLQKFTLPVISASLIGEDLDHTTAL